MKSRKILICLSLFFLAFVSVFLYFDKNKSDIESNSNSNSEKPVLPRSESNSHSNSRADFVLGENDSLILANCNLLRSDKQANDLWEAFGFERYWLASYVKDGEPVDLVKQCDYKSDLYSSLESFLKTDTNANYIKAKDYFTEDSTGYELLTDDDIVIKYYGDVAPFLSKVKYVNYCNDNQPPKEEWADAFKKELYRHHNSEYGYYEPIMIYNYEPPIIYRESWTYQKDGVTIEIVTACNVPNTEQLSRAEIETADKNLNRLNSQIHQATYQITLMFYISDREEERDSYRRLSFMTMGYGELPSGWSEDMYTTGEYYAYFYDEQNNIKLFPIYSGFIIDSPYRYYRLCGSYCFLDIDGDAALNVLQTPYSGTVNRAFINVFNPTCCETEKEYLGPLFG